MNRDTLLIVDDMEINRAILRALFEQEYNLLEAENGEQAILLIKQYRDSLAAVLLDLVMPVKSGYQVMTELSRDGLMASIPIVVITSEDSMENEVRAFDMGAADIIIKPFEPHVVRRRVQNAVELNLHKMHLEELVEEQAVKLRESRDVIMDTLSSVIEHRSAETGQHVLRIRMFTKLLLENVMTCCPEYELDERAVGVIAEASALHDIGKIAIPDTILNKPGRLTAEEFEVMKTHTVKGCEILAGLDRMADRDYLGYAYNICRYHHERWDGRGYPEGLKGDNTPIGAQVVGIADCYDALTTDRVYKKAIPPDRAMTMILNGECGTFSPKLLECLKNVGDAFSELSRCYADGQEPRESLRTPDRPAAHAPGDKGTQEQLGQMKYFALLRYLGRTVMEVDLDGGVYHLVHQENEDFQPLRAGATFTESIRAFAQQAVHPDDRPLVLEILDRYIEEFFGSGVMKRSRRYRVFHRTTGEYVWYEGTVLRVDIDDPKRRKLLLVWQRLDQPAAQAQADAAGAPLPRDLPVGVLQCINDQWHTMTYVNEDFLTLFGYSREELRERFHDRFIDMIHPDDRQGACRRFLQQVAAGGVGEQEYRVIDRRGETVWVLSRCRVLMGPDGRERINCVLTDMTQVRQGQEALRLSMERYEIILDQTNDIIFEWDPKQDTLAFSPNWGKKFGYVPVSEHVLSQIRTASHLFPEDIGAFMDLAQKTAAGTPYGEAEVRIAKADGRYLWCRLRATTQFDSEGRPVKVVGVILDIDQEKRRTQELIHQAQRDPLTKLYSKNTAGDMIQRRLERRGEGESFALMIIDLDNFKKINDSKGHMFGDCVLAEAATRLDLLFGGEPGGVVSRFGGDEFLVFLPCPAEETAREWAARAMEDLRNVLADDLRDCGGLSCSIGVARCPEDGLDFRTLFQRGDQALYQAKQKGKDRAAFYEAATMGKIFGLEAQRVYAADTHIDSDDVPDFGMNGLVLQAFKLLYESQDVETAVNAILEMAGRKYNVSRVYIFEDSEDGTWCRNTFEWCAAGIQPEIDRLQHVIYAENYRGNFDERGIFYCPDVTVLPKEQYDVLGPQGIRSMLQCAVRDGGRFVGFVGFDDCVIQRMWTQGQIDALTFISELLSTFLLKKRAQDRALAAVRDLRMALDSQNSWIYVIDPETCELRYINAKTLRTVPDARLGMRCHEAFFHRDAPCSRCPARDIRRLRNQTLEIYNPVLKIWSLADASMIRWGEEDACLLSCQDVTRYHHGAGEEETE